MGAKKRPMDHQESCLFSWPILASFGLMLTTWLLLDSCLQPGLTNGYKRFPLPCSCVKEIVNQEIPSDIYNNSFWFLFFTFGYLLNVESYQIHRFLSIFSYNYISSMNLILSSIIISEFLQIIIDIYYRRVPRNEWNREAHAIICVSLGFLVNQFNELLWDSTFRSCLLEFYSSGSCIRFILFSY